MAGNLNSNIPKQAIHNTLTEGEEVTVEGRIYSGAKAVSVSNTGAANGTFDGVTITPGEVFNYPYVGSTYEEISFNATGTTLKIFVFR